MTFNILNIFRKPKRVFLDFASSTPISKKVLDVLNSYSRNFFENPSALYLGGRESKELLISAKKKTAEVLNCFYEDVLFTSGGTESNNMAILGVFEKAKLNGIKTPHIVSVNTEHPSVLETLLEVQNRGGEVTLLHPDKEGLVSLKSILDSIKENTILVSVMYVNNEIGVVQDIKEIGQAIKKYKKEENKNYPYFHTDASQAPLYYSLDVSTLCVDLLSLDGIKIYGPRSVGILYVKNGLSIKPILFGGGQEKNLRSGTENPVSAFAFSVALQNANKNRKKNFEKVSKLRDYFLEKILKNFKNTSLNGSLKHRSPNNINVCFDGLDAEYLVVALDTYGVCASYSSSCRTLKEDSSSYVIEALGKENCKEQSIRFTLGLETTKTDLDFTLDVLKKAIKQVEL